jgi:hypothetical protein
MQPKTITSSGTKMKSEVGPPHVIDSLNFLCVWLLLMRVAQKLCRSKHGVFTSRTCIQSQILIHIEIICCCLWSI